MVTVMTRLFLLVLLIVISMTRLTRGKNDKCLTTEFSSCPDTKP